VIFDALLTLLFILFFFFKNMQAWESWKVEEQANQPAWGRNLYLSCIQGPSRHVLKQDKYLVHSLCSLSHLPRQEGLAGTVP